MIKKKSRWRSPRRPASAETFSRSSSAAGGRWAGVSASRTSVTDTAWRRRWRSISCFFCSSRRRHTSLTCDWSSDVCSSDLPGPSGFPIQPPQVFKEKLLGWVGVEEIVHELIVADAPDLIASQPAQSLRADGEGRVFARLGAHRSHSLHGSYHAYR